MRTSELKPGEAYELKRHGRANYIGYDHDPAWKNKPLIFEATHGYEIHAGAMDVLQTWAERQEQEAALAEKVGQRNQNLDELISFFNRYGIEAGRHRPLMGGQLEGDVRVEPSEDKGWSVLTMRWSTLDELLTKYAEAVSEGGTRHDLVTARSEA